MIIQRGEWNSEIVFNLRAKSGGLPPYLALQGVKIKYTQHTSSTYFLLSHMKLRIEHCWASITVWVHIFFSVQHLRFLQIYVEYSKQKDRIILLLNVLSIDLLSTANNIRLVV